MYNNEIKEKFIEHIKCGKNSTYTEIVVKIFTISEPMENEAHKDLAYFTKKEFLDLYLKMKIKSYNTYKRRKWLVNQYLKWYGALCGKNIPAIRFSAEEIDSIILQRAGWNYFSDASIKRFILNYYLKTTSFMIYAIYCGVYGKNLEELSFMKISDIDMKTKTIKLYAYNDETKEKSYQREILIDDMFLDLAKQVNSEQTYTDDTGRELGKLEKTDYIIKQREGSLKTASDDMEVLKSKYKLITKRIQRVNENDSFEMKGLTIISIRYSGLINYLKKLAKNLDVVFDHENMVENIENKVMLRNAAKHYNLSVANVERILEEYFQLII